MKKLMLGLVALLLAASQSAHAGLVFAVQNYTGNSVTFSLSGDMPATAPLLFGGAGWLSLRYTGDLWLGGETEAANTLSADPLLGAGGLDPLGSMTGGFADVDENYSILLFQNNLTGLTGTGAPVTVSWGGVPLLNTSGTGQIELFWGSLALGVDQAKQDNTPFGAVQVVDGRIVADTNDVPEPAGIALFGLGLLALGTLRRRQA